MTMNFRSFVQYDLHEFCLQEHRQSPILGAAYKASGLSSLSLAVGGKQIDVTHLATIKSVRNFLSSSSIAARPASWWRPCRR